NLDSHGRGGGGNGGDFRSLISFTFLALAILLAFQYFKPSSSTPPQQAQPQQKQQAPAPASPQPVESSAPVAAAAKAAPKAKQPVTATPTIAATSETETTVENELYKIVFTNRGAQVKHWILKKYTDNDGKPLDLVQTQGSAHYGLPLSFFTYEPALSNELNSALYRASASGNLLAPATLTFSYAKNGLDVVKTFQFDSSYVIGVETQVHRNGQLVRALVQWPAGLGDQTDSMQFASSKIAWNLGGKDDSMAAKKVSGNATLDQPYQYVAVMDLYFAAAFLPGTPEQTTLVTLHHTIDVPADQTNPNSQKRPESLLGVAVGNQSGSTHARLFVGPKATDVLKSVHVLGADGKPVGTSLEPLIQYGWETIIAKPLYFALRLMVEHGFGNWGWSIIIFTVVFTVLMLPMRFMSMKSSLKMMRIQPKVDAVKKRYSHLKINDPKRSQMNAEMMELYKTEGVNMYGGCLPMLPQIPLFFAYYKVLLNAVELRHAHWLWLPDLSAPDPTHILPILIIVTMFLTQYITPSPGMDPTQRRMMAFMMPVFFGFMLWHYASGLALYWATSNVINMALQVGVNQSKIGKEMHELSARRAVKKGASGGRVVQGRR
ncbi:MAG TPA: membrane protein insertase YidC, partial [Terracidiphilus sp.]|nr:membrane protein insertase YidC [Terracidiphilus sp.]